MAIAGDPVPDLKEKVNFLSRLAGEDAGKKPLTRRAFALHCGIEVAALEECLKDRVRRMSLDLQKAIAAKFGFSVDDPAWFDRHAAIGAVRRDGIQAFEPMMRRLRAGAIPLRFSPQPPTLTNRNLAMFDISDQKLQAGAGLGILVFFEGYFKTGIDNKDVYGFSRVRLVFDLDDRHGSIAVARLGFSEDARLGDAELTCDGTEHHPEWMLAATTGALSGRYITDETPLFELKQGTLDQEVVARLMVQLRDDDIHVETNGKSGSSCAKARVLNRLRAMRQAQTEPDADGWLELGVQRLPIVEASS